MEPWVYRASVFCAPISEFKWTRWLPGNQTPQSAEELLEKYKKDATKAGYKDVSKYICDLHYKDPEYLKVSARLYQECAAEHGATSKDCKIYKNYWRKCKAAQNA